MSTKTIQQQERETLRKKQENKLDRLVFFALDRYAVHEIIESLQRVAAADVLEETIIDSNIIPEPPGTYVLCDNIKQQDALDTFIENLKNIY